MSLKRALPLAAAFCLLSVVAAPVLAARETRATGPDPAVAEWPEWPHRVVCGGVPFDPIAAFSSPTGVERKNTPQVRAMEEFIHEGDAEEFVRKRDWRVLVRRPKYVEFGSGRLPHWMEVISVREAHGEWSFSGYSSRCEPASLRHGRPAISWTLARGQHINARTTKVEVNLGPGECNDGKSQNDRVQKPEFREQNGALLMTLWLRPVSPGLHTCEGLIEPPFTVNLPEPLGHRRLMDGGTYPPGTGLEEELEGF